MIEADYRLYLGLNGEAQAVLYATTVTAHTSQIRRPGGHTWSQPSNMTYNVAEPQ